MTNEKKDRNTTRIRRPGSAVKKIPKRYKASIVILTGYAVGMEYPITMEYTVLGRDKTAGIVVKDSLVSRQHAAIAFHDGEFRLKDLGSMNGTLMNGTIVEVATLRHKDKFSIGDTVFQFILETTNEGDTYEISE